MGLFDGLFKKTKSASDGELRAVLMGVPIIHEDAWVCIEPKATGTSPLLTAAVLLDQENNVGVCFFDADMSWLSGLSLTAIWVEPWHNNTALDQPLVVIHNDVLLQMNQSSAARIILQKTDKTATYVAFPWPADSFNEIVGIDRWIFWSFLNENRNDEAHYWGFGDFGDEETFEQLIERVAVK